MLGLCLHQQHNSASLFCPSFHISHNTHQQKQQRPQIYHRRLFLRHVSFCRRKDCRMRTQSSDYEAGMVSRWRGRKSSCFGWASCEMWRWCIRSSLLKLQILYFIQLDFRAGKRVWSSEVIQAYVVQLWIMQSGESMEIRKLVLHRYHVSF